MLRQIQYFQAVVRNNSFSEAAEECHISQSAISQQIKALESELGFPLLERRNRTFGLTPAGRHFYQKSLALTADYTRLRTESAKIARGDAAVLKLGYLRGHGKDEIHRALGEFTEKYPRVSVQLLPGTHEELFDRLRSGDADLVFNDQRRAFSEEYVNLVLSAEEMWIAISAHHPIAKCEAVTAQDLKNVPCILISPPGQWETEQEYYRSVIGLSGSFLRAEDLEEAELLVAGGRGFFPVGRGEQSSRCKTQVIRVPLCRGADPSKLLPVLEKRGVRLLCRGVCREFETSIRIRTTF